MACFRCDRLQTDPVKGPSDWARFVLKGEQVLMCPNCKSDDPGWTTLGDVCPTCNSRRLVVMMDMVVCKACGRDFDRTGFR